VDTPWLTHYQSGVPKTVHVPANLSLVHLLQDACQRYADHIAFENFGQRLTYQALQEESLAFASFLQKSGLKKGDRVAVMMPNILQYPVAMMGILLAGGVVVNTNPLYTAAELTHQLNDAEVSILIVLNYLSPLIQTALPALPQLKHIILTQIGDYLPPLKRWGIQLYLRYIQKQPAPVALARSISFTQALRQGKAATFTPVKLTGKDLAFLQYTGGTTGIAKGAMLSHHNMLSNIEQAFAWIAPALIGPDDIIITALPLYHIFALTANCFTFLKTGAS
jgi:long-chain acyl-CoA synthetase